jgi:Domain of unknown function (DUF5615)
VRLLADVNVSRHVVARLREEGFDIVRVPEILDPRTPDEDIIAEAHRRGAVVLSHEETTALEVPCLTLRHNTERPVTLKLGTNRLVAAIGRETLEGNPSAPGSADRRSRGRQPPL